MMRGKGLRPPPTRKTLLLVLRDRAGSVAHVAIGSAILDADWAGALSMLPSGKEAESLTTFFSDTPAQAEHAIDVLADLGDVPLGRRDFAPKWFSPGSGVVALNWLLGHRAKARRLLTDGVCGELQRVHRVLEGARRSGHRFHFAEV